MGRRFLGSGCDIIVHHIFMRWGGIFIDDFNDQRHHLPGLGDISWLRWLFGQSQQRKQRQELMVFITPKMLSLDVGTGSP